MPLGTMAGIGAIGAIGSSIVQSNAADKQAKVAARAAKENNALNTRIYEETKAGYQPYLAAGTAALDPLLASYGLKGQAAQNAVTDIFHNSPDYAWAKAEGERGVEASVAGRALYTGGTLKRLQRYGSDYANGYLNNWRQGVAGIANMGVGAQGNIASVGQNYAQAYGANTNRAADARVSAYGQQADAISGGLNDLSTLAAYGAGNWRAPVNAGGGRASGYGFGKL